MPTKFRILLALVGTSTLLSPSVRAQTSSHEEPNGYDLLGKAVDLSFTHNAGAKAKQITQMSDLSGMSAFMENNSLAKIGKVLGKLSMGKETLDAYRSEGGRAAVAKGLENGLELIASGTSLVPMLTLGSAGGVPGMMGAYHLNSAYAKGLSWEVFHGDFMRPFGVNVTLSELIGGGRRGAEPTEIGGDGGSGYSEVPLRQTHELLGEEFVPGDPDNWSLGDVEKALEYADSMTLGEAMKRVSVERETTVAKHEGLLSNVEPAEGGLATAEAIPQVTPDAQDVRDLFTEGGKMAKPSAGQKPDEPKKEEGGELLTLENLRKASEDPAFSKLMQGQGQRLADWYNSGGMRKHSAAMAALQKHAENPSWDDTAGYLMHLAFLRDTPELLRPFREALDRQKRSSSAGEQSATEAPRKPSSVRDLFDGEGGVEVAGEPSRKGDVSKVTRSNLKLIDKDVEFSRQLSSAGFDDWYRANGDTYLEVFMGFGGGLKGDVLENQINAGLELRARFIREREDLIVGLEEAITRVSQPPPDPLAPLKKTLERAGLSPSEIEEALDAYRDAGLEQ